jgi:hypothetical protein
MLRSRSPVWGLLMVVGLLVAAAVLGVATASGRTADAGILNQTLVHDPTGDSGNGPDLSSLTTTSYADGSISFAVGFANRNAIQPGESVQIFVDVNDDGTQDLNLSIWPFGDPSYLARWTGSGWEDIRQLPELALANGSFSVRLSLADLAGAAAVPVAASVGVAVAAWSSDPGNTAPNDSLPDGRLWSQHQIAAPPAPPTTTTPAAPAPPRLAVVCAKPHTLRVTVTRAVGGPQITSVVFSANGKPRPTNTHAPFTALIPTRGIHAPITITASVHASSARWVLHAQAGAC